MRKFWIIKVVLLGVLAILVMSVILMLLWNWLAPRLFDGPTISLWQSVGLLVLAKLLLGSWSPSRWVSGRRQKWRQRFADRWNRMTPEEQACFKRKFTHRCRGWRWEEEVKDVD